LIQRGFIEDGLREEQYFEKPYEKFKYELEVQNVEDNGGAGLLNETVLTISWLSGSKKKSIAATTYLFNFLE